MSNANTYPYAASKLANQLTVLFSRPETPVDAVAQALGHPNSRFLTAVAQGEHRLPLDQAPALAEALGVDALLLLAFATRSYSEGLADCLDGYCQLAAATSVTAKIEVG